MYVSVERKSSKKKFLDRYTCPETDPESHGKGFNELNILNINFVENL